MLLSIRSHLTGQEPWKLTELRYNHAGLVVDLGVGLWAWPMPLDYDRDGDLDLLVSCPDKPSNGVYFFENPSQDPAERMPVFKPGIRLGKTGQNMQVSYVDGEPRILRTCWEYVPDSKTGWIDFDRGHQIYPRANPHVGKVRANMWRYVDYDGDSDHDLVVGVGDWSDYGWDNAFDHQGRWRNGPLHGFLYLIRNEGDDLSPVYSEVPEQLTAGGGNIDVYGWPSPNFADFDSDGDLDLLCGEFLDGFTYFENTGSRTKPDYAAGERLSNTDGQPLVMDLQMITPTAIDWDRDGDTDLIVGDEDGRVALIENCGRLRGRKPVFHAPRYFQQEADTLKFGALATPFVCDWDGDGDEDILCGNTAGRIGLFENLGPAANGLPKWSAPSLLEARESAPGSTATPFRIMAGAGGSIQGPAEAKWGYTTFSVADLDH
ncbi:MAG: VCBS repeat-containing protein, partial [Planctomycetota bacterium]